MATSVPQAPAGAPAAPAPPRAARGRRSRGPIAAAAVAAGLCGGRVAGVVPPIAVPIALALPIAAVLFGPLFHVDTVRRILWVLLCAVTVAALGPDPAPREAVLGTALLVAAAGWLALRAYRDPRWQIRSCLRALAVSDLDRAHLAYGRFLRLGRDPGDAFWRAVRASEIRDVDAIRPRFGGMVNAIRYGERGAMGDRAFAALFPEVGASRASAEEG